MTNDDRVRRPAGAWALHGDAGRWLRDALRRPRRPCAERVEDR